MANVTSTAPAAFDYLLNAIIDASALEDIHVFDAELAQYEPGQYIQLLGVSNHRFEIESMPWNAFTESYDIDGVVRVWRGDLSASNSRDDAFTAYQNYVMTPVVNSKTLNNIVMWIVPQSANFETTYPEEGGCQTVISFAFAVSARVTI